MKTTNLQKELTELLKKHNIELSNKLLSEFNQILGQKDSEELELIRKHDLLYNNSHLSYQSLDINGNILETNKTWLKTLGYKKSEVIGKWFGEFLHKDHIEIFKKRFEKFKKEGTVEDVQFQIRKKNGEYALVSYKGCVLYKQDGEFKCTYCSFVDITKQEEAYKRLEISNERYLNAQKMGNVGNWEYNIQAGNFWGSEQAKRIYGFHPTKDKFTTEHIESCIPERERVHQALVDLIKYEKEYNLEFEIIPKDGAEPRIIKSKAELVKDIQGNPLKVVGVIHDITEQKWAEIALKESEEKYRKLTENSPEITYINNLNKGALYWSSKVKDVLGFDPNKIIKETTQWTKSLHKEDVPKIDKILSNIKVGKTYELEYRIYDVNGNLHWFYDRLFNIYKKNGDTIIEGIISDITDKKRVETELKESEKKYRKLVDNQGEGIGILNKDEIFTYSNPAAERIFGVKKGELIGDSIYNFLLPKEQQRIKKETAKRKTGKKSTYELQIVRPDGEIRIINVTATPDYDEYGNYLNSFGIFRDITRQKEIEKKLTESEERFKKLSQLTFEGIVIHKNGVSIDCNQSFLNLLQYNKKEVIHKNVLDYIAKEYHDKVKENITKNIAKPYEVEALRKDGVRIPVEIEARNVTINNELIRVAAIRDVTERKKSQLALKESEIKYNSLFSSMNEGVVLHEVVYNKQNVAIDYEIIESNKAFENQTGIKSKTSTHKLASKFYKTSPAPYLDIYAKVAETGKPTEFESFFPPLKKHFNISVFSPKKGWFATVFTDITERKNSEIKLRELLEKSQKSQAEITELLNATNSILKSGDFNTIAREIFDACKRAIGAKAGYVAMLSDDGAENELLFLDDGGLPCDVNPELPMPIRGLRADAYKTGKVVYDNNFMESKWVKFMPKNHLYLKNVLFAPLIIDNKTIGLLGISNKHNDFNQEDARLAKAFAEYASIALKNSRNIEALKNNNEKLHDLNATKDKFFSIIAHDLRGPANNLVGFADLLERNYLKYDKDKLSHIINLMTSAAKGTFNLLENLLIWSRSQQDKISYNPEPFLCKELVKEVIQEMEYLASAKKLKLISDRNTGHLVDVDKDMFKTVYRNLISNAIKFTNEGGEISIGCGKVTDDFVEFYVKDNGVGIPNENIHKIFRIDENITTQGTNQERGTGLGLILCKDFIEKHGGKIWVESEVNKGSTFWFTFPKSTKNK